MILWYLWFWSDTCDWLDRLTFAQRQQQKMRARKEWEQDHQHVVNDAIAKEDDMNTCQQQVVCVCVRACVCVCVCVCEE